MQITSLHKLALASVGVSIGLGALFLFLRRSAAHTSDLFEDVVPTAQQEEPPGENESDWETEYSDDEELNQELREASIAYLREELLRLTVKKTQKPGSWTSADEEELERVVADLREFMKMGAVHDDDLRDDDEWDDEEGYDEDAVLEYGVHPDEDEEEEEPQTAPKTKKFAKRRR